MSDFYHLGQDRVENTYAMPDPSLDGFCPDDPMFRGVFDLACLPDEQAFSDQVPVGHEGKSQAASEAL